MKGKREKTSKFNPQGDWVGTPKKNFTPNLVFFVTINFVQNLKTVAQPLLREKYVVKKKERKRRYIITKIVDTSFRSHTNGQRMHSVGRKRNYDKISGHFVQLFCLCTQLCNGRARTML